MSDDKQRDGERDRKRGLGSGGRKHDLDSPSDGKRDRVSSDRKHDLCSDDRKPILDVERRRGLSSAPGLSVISPVPSSPASLPTTSPFGTPMMSGGCSPMDTTADPGIASTTSTAGLGDVPASSFSDATVPLNDTESGGTGLSPLIVVPTPDGTEVGP